MKTYKIDFPSLGQTIEIPEGTNLMKAMNESGINYDFPCGGNGRCGKCKVRISGEGLEKETKESKVLSQKEINEGIRLACSTKIQGDMTIEFVRANTVKHQILATSDERKLKIEPHVAKKYVEVKKPVFGEHYSDWTRLKESLFVDEHAATSDAQMSVLTHLPRTLRKSDFKVTAVTYNDQIIGIEEQDTTGKLLGMAFDIGSTTIVGFLMDLNTGKELGVASTLNPQAKYGADVISRISFTEQNENGLEILHTAVVGAMNKLIAEAAEKAGVSIEDIYAITVAGNTTMYHLFLGLDPRYISKAPFVPTTCDPIAMDAGNLGLNINKTGKLFVLPNIAGFVGADTVAVLLSTEMEKSEDIKLMIDIGTNGEIALGSKDKLYACSCAAGPAFEGAQISSGMRGAIGAIDHVKFGEKLEYTVIGDVKPQGICGSGLLDIISGFIEIGIVNERGRILRTDELAGTKAEAFKNYIVEYEGAAAFLIADENSTESGKPIMITQMDIRQFQLAKAAMSSGVKILMEKCGVEVDDVKEVLLAGAFGNYMNPHSACVIGLIPRELENRIKSVGNAAGTGAKVALLSSSEFKRAGDISKSVEFVELATHPKFNSIYAKSAYFK